MQSKQQKIKRKLLLTILAALPASVAFALLAQGDTLTWANLEKILTEIEKAGKSAELSSPTETSPSEKSKGSVTYTACPSAWTRDPKIIVAVSDCDCKTWWDGKSVSEARGEKVLCTELYCQGLLAEKIYRADSEYAKRIHPFAVSGYHFWAKPLARIMRRNRTVVSLLRPPIEAWAKHMAFELGVIKKDNLFGKILAAIGIPLCFMLGSGLCYFKLFGNEVSCKK